MTKKEIIDVLVNEYGVEDRNLMKNTLKDLERMLEEFKNIEEVVEEFENVDEIVEENAVEVIEENVEDGEITLKGDLKSAFSMEDSKVEEVVSEVQLNIYETVVRRFEPPIDLNVENLGEGDIFISEDKENLMQKQNRVSPGMGVGMVGVSILYITSASRPVVRIVY